MIRLLGVLSVLLFAGTSYGQVCAHCGRPIHQANVYQMNYVQPYQTPVRTAVPNIGQSFGGPLDGLAQQKAEQAARMRLKGHLGTGISYAQAEGVGFSSISPQDAINIACYSNHPRQSKAGPYKTRLGTGVCYNAQERIWYSCILVGR